MLTQQSLQTLYCSGELSGTCVGWEWTLARAVDSHPNSPGAAKFYLFSTLRFSIMFCLNKGFCGSKVQTLIL